MWIGGARRKLERPVETGPLAEPKDQLLDCEVSGVADASHRVMPEVHPQRKVQRDRRTLPGIEGQPTAETELEGAHRRLGKPDTRAQRRLGQAAAEASRPDLAAEPSQLLAVATGGLGRENGPSELRHRLCMVAGRAWRALSCERSLARWTLPL